MTEVIPKFGKKYTFFRPNYAINFQAVVSKKGFGTINVEIAPALKTGADWDKKITLQLSEVDLFKYFYTFSHQVFFTYESKHHGPDKNKSIRFEEDLSGCTITLSDAGNVVFFKCSVGEWFYAQLLMLEKLLNHPLSVSEARELMIIQKKPSK